HRIDRRARHSSAAQNIHAYFFAAEETHPGNRSRSREEADRSRNERLTGPISQTNQRSVLYFSRSEAARCFEACGATNGRKSGVSVKTPNIGGANCSAALTEDNPSSNSILRIMLI